MFKQSKILEEVLDSVLLMEFRATPIRGMKYSPSQLLMSRRLRTRLPCLDSQLAPNVVMEAQHLLIQKQQLQKICMIKMART